MPILQKSSTRRRSRFGDFLTVLLLAAAVGAVIWFWWHQKHQRKPAKPKPVALAPAVIMPAATVPANIASPVLPAEKMKPIVVAPQAPVDFPRPVRDVFEAQIALARRAISPGSIDAAIGSQTRAAIAAFQRSQKLFESGLLDTNTRPRLTLDAPLLADYIVTTNDFARLQPIGKTWLEKSQQSALDYETILELVAEKSHSHPLLIQKLNPGVNWTNVSAGTILKIPDVTYPGPDDKAAFVINPFV